MGDPADDIMRATFCALCEHGYADLTMQHIADEADRSTASLHYHYDSKRGLLSAFLDHLYEEFRDHVGTVDSTPDRPDERLRTFLDAVLHPPREDSMREFRTAVLEIRTQAPYEEAFRERLVTFDDHVYDVVHDLVSTGVRTGVYRDDVDPDEVARFVLAVLHGAQTRHVVAGEDVDAVQAALESYLDDRLCATEVST